ncbi:alpha-amylase, partial [Lachnotalea glycerini]
RDGSNYNYSWNCGVEGQTRRKGIVELRKKQIKNALLMLLLSQGVPSILSGDEIANSQKGNNNPYCQDNDIAWLNWNGEKQHKDILNFTKMLIHFRKNHPILHYETELKIMDYLSCGYPDLSYHGEKAWYPDFENYNRQIGVMYCGQYAKTSKGKEDDYIYIAYNMHWIEHEFALPNLPMKKKWKVIIDTSKNTEDEQKTVYRNIKVNERSIVVLVGK